MRVQIVSQKMIMNWNPLTINGVMCFLRDMKIPPPDNNDDELNEGQQDEEAKKQVDIISLSLEEEEEEEKKKAEIAAKAQAAQTAALNSFLIEVKIKGSNFSRANAANLC